MHLHYQNTGTQVKDPPLPLRKEKPIAAGMDIGSPALHNSETPQTFLYQQFVLAHISGLYLFYEAVCFRIWREQIQALNFIPHKFSYPMGTQFV